MSVTSTINSDQDIVDTWLNDKRAHDVPPMPVFKAHLDLNGQGCESEACPICWVYCATAKNAARVSPDSECDQARAEVAKLKAARKAKPARQRSGKAMVGGGTGGEDGGIGAGGA